MSLILPLQCSRMLQLPHICSLVVTAAGSNRRNPISIRGRVELQSFITVDIMRRPNWAESSTTYVPSKTREHKGVYNQLLTRLLLQLKSWGERGESHNPLL